MKLHESEQVEEKEAEKKKKRKKKKESGACQVDQLKLASPQEIKEGRGRKAAYLSCHLSLIGDGQPVSNSWTE